MFLFSFHPAKKEACALLGVTVSISKDKQKAESKEAPLDEIWSSFKSKI